MRQDVLAMGQNEPDCGEAAKKSRLY